MPSLSTKSNPAFNPADFVSTVIDNPYFALQPGTTLVYDVAGTDQLDNFNVTRGTKVIAGVTCTVVHDVALEGGEIVEDTLDYFAQDKFGNVWYFGEDTKKLEDGKVVSTEGSWLAGVNGASPGIIMEASPKVGDEYFQENAPGVAEDRAQVLSLTQIIDVPYGSFNHVLETKDFTPLDPTNVEHKLYALGIGQVDAIDVNTGEQERLVKIIFTGTDRGETIDGKAGRDELNGLAGDDHLNGRGGSDIVKGGRGDDWLDGGNDKDVDLLYGNQGRDHINLRIGDQGFGGSGNDVLRLFDNEHFGSVSGGDQNGHNLANNKGDVLQFEGELDLTHKGLSERITGIETISMVGKGEDELTLSARDVLDLGEGTFNPTFSGKDKFGDGAALRIDGGAGDEVTLTGGKWHEIEATNAPAHYDVYAQNAASGPAYVLIHENVEVELT